MADEPRLREFRIDDSLADVAWKLRARVFGSQVQAAQHLGVNRSTVLRYENGDIAASLGYLAALCRAIADRAAVSGQELDTLRGRLVQELNKVRATFYREEFPFESWVDVVRAADRYLAEVEKRRTETSSKPPPIHDPHKIALAPAEEERIGRANWPFPLTNFVGRERERSEVKQLLASARLVTLTGVGGSGKTRLALELAADLLGSYSDGIWLVELAAVTHPELLPQAIAAALGVKEEPGEPLIATLSGYVRDRELLMVLDNFEHVIESARLITDLLAVAPRIKVLVTSITRLRLRGEREYTLLPLALPDIAHLPPVEQLLEYEAIRLFVARARDAKPDFTLTGANAAAVAEICARLDGLPLAIELAASRIKTLPPGVMLRRLQSRLDLLTGGAHDLPTRQQTLRGALDWSYNLLNGEEQVLFRRLGVFAGSCTLEAAEAICRPATPATDHATPPHLATLNNLASLVDKSLLRQQDTLGGEIYFWMLQTIHEYALERLSASGEGAEIGKKYADYYLLMGEDAEAKLKGPEQEEVAKRLEMEQDNLRAVLDGALQRGESNIVGEETAARLAGALWRFWLSHGYLSEGRRWLERATAPDIALSPRVRAKALHGLGVLTANQGEHAQARNLMEEAVALYREVREPQGVADALNSLGLIACHQDDPHAQLYFEESLALQRALGNNYGVAAVLHNLGMMAEDQGEYAQAEPLYEESLLLARKMGDKEGAAWALNGLGQVALDRGDYRQALARYGESLALCQDIGDKMGVALCLERLGGVAAEQRQPTRAALLLGSAEALREAMGSYMEPAYREAYDRVVAKAREQLDPLAWGAAWGEGRTTPLDQVLELTIKYYAESDNQD
ncbi:MAG TPA: tetratricopeptide repeat protein [Chloroflexia bacterium]|nr:tetratricopeptide repeat protein [Chloroflexia bacterium]